MRNGTLKYPENRFDKHLPKQMSDNSVKQRFNDFMAQCRHSSFVRYTASPQNRIRDDPPGRVITEVDRAAVKSTWKQKMKSSTIKTNVIMSKEIFVAFATQKGGIGKSTVTALAASYLHNVKGYNVASWTATIRSTASADCVNMKRNSSAAVPTSRLLRAITSAKSKRTPTPSSKVMR